MPDHNLRARCLVLLGLLVAPMAHADRLKARRVESTNTHIGDGEGAISIDEEVTITADLHAKRRVEVTAVGTRSEGNLTASATASHYTDDRTSWTTTWKGTYSRTRGQLRMELELVKHDCKAERIADGKSTPGTCGTPSQHASLVCNSERVEVETTGAKPARVAAWRCAPSGTTELAESVGTWLFGKTGCLESHDGRMGARSVGRCGT